MASVRQRGNRFMADLKNPDGTRLRKAFGTEEEAWAYIRIKESAYGEGVSDATTLGPFIEESFDHLWGDSKRPDAPRINCRVIQKYIPSYTPLHLIDGRLVVSMIQRMKDDGSANGTINRKLATLSKILDWAVYLKTIETRPKIKYLEEAKGRDRVLSYDEEDRVLDFFEHIGLTKTRALVQFLLYTGCRTGEAFKLDRKDVTRTHVTFLWQNNKTNITRTLPLVPEAREAWETICKLTNLERPFMSITYDTFKGHWKRMRDYMGALDDPCFVPHMLRHTCATRLILDKNDLPRVMKWMGHKSIQTTMRYTHLITEDLDLCAVSLSRRGT